MNYKQVTRFTNGEKVVTIAEPTPFESARGKEILSNAMYGNYDAQMTDGEIAYTRRVWQFMDGNTSFHSALCRIANGNLPHGFWLECDKCASAESGHNIHCPNSM